MKSRDSKDPIIKIIPAIYTCYECKLKTEFFHLRINVLRNDASRQVELESLYEARRYFCRPLSSSAVEFSRVYRCHASRCSFLRVFFFFSFFFFLFFSFIYPEDAIVIMGGPIRDGMRRAHEGASISEFI